MELLREAPFSPLPCTQGVGEVGTAVVLLASLSPASQQGRAFPSLLPSSPYWAPRGSGVSPVGQRLTAPGRGYRERGLRGAERAGETVETGATPSPETDGEPRKTLSLKKDRARRRRGPPAWDPDAGG